MSIKACELMVEAQKNPEKYEGKRYKGVPIRDGAGNGYSELYVNDGKLLVGDSLWAYMHSNTKLEEIKTEPKPVPFMEAVKAYTEGKKIRVTLDDGFKTIYDPIHRGGTVTFNSSNSNNHSEINAAEILEGTWYIKE